MNMDKEDQHWTGLGSGLDSSPTCSATAPLLQGDDAGGATTVLAVPCPVEASIGDAIHQ